MAQNKFIFVSFCCFCFVLVGQAGADTLQLSTVVSAALTQHPVVAAAATEIDAARGEIRAAEGGFDPTLKIASSDYITGDYTGGYLDASVEQPTALYGTKFIAGYRKSGGSFPVYYADQETEDDGEVRAGIEVPVLRDGEIDRRRTALQKANLQQNVSEASLLQRRVEIARAAKHAYLDWIAAGRRLTIQKALLDVTERRQGQLAHRQEKGDIAQFDVIDNERSVLQRQALVVQAERQLQQASFELSLFYRADTGEPRIPSSTLLPTDLPAFSPHDLYSFEEELQKAYLARPDLIRLKQQREQNALEIKLADNQLLPRLDIQMAAAQDLGPQESKLDEFELRGGIKLEVPIFNRVAMGRQQSLQAKDKELGFLIAFLQDRIRADLKDVLTAIKLSRERVGVLTNEYQTAQRVEEGERERYSHGDSNLIFVNLREQTSADAAILVVDAKLDYHKAKASLAAILGKDS